MAKTRAKRLPKEEWARHKEYISDMYISRNASLKEVLDYLHQSGLNSTQHQLRQQLKKWGLKKNMEADEWGRIAHLVAKRSLNGKITSIIRNGRYYGPSKIAKEIGRHCTVSDMTRFTKEPTPVCPSSVTMSTPQPMLIGITWPNSLPWLHFGNRYASLLEQWCQPLGLGLPLARAVMRLGIPVDLLQLGVFESTQHTLSTPWKLCSSHLVAQNLPTDAPGQAIGILAYILSNNQQRLFFSNGLRVRAQQFDVLCGILVNSGLMELGAAAAYSSDYTAAAVLENLLHLVDWPPMSGNVLASLGQQSIALISWALQSPPKSFARMLRTVIYNATIRPLLLFRSRRTRGSSHSDQFEGWIKLIETILIHTGRPTAMHLLRLFPRGNEALPLMAALNQQPPRLALVQILLKNMPSLSEMASHIDIWDEDGGMLFTDISPLVCAAWSLEESVASSTMELILASRQSQRCVTPGESFDVMLALCYRGHDSLLDDWMRQNTDFDIDGCNTTGYTMLHAAVIGCHSSTCEKLLRLGAKVHATQSRLAPPLYFALQRRVRDVDFDISIQLAQWGARIDCRFSCSVGPYDRWNSDSIHSMLNEAKDQGSQQSPVFAFLVAMCTSLHPDANHQGMSIAPFLRQAMFSHSTSAKLPPVETSVGFVHSVQEMGVIRQASDVFSAMEAVSAEFEKMSQHLTAPYTGFRDTEKGEDAMISHNSISSSNDPPPAAWYDSKVLLDETQEACREGSEPPSMLLFRRPVVLTGDENEATAVAFAASHGNHGVLRVLLDNLPPTICNCKFGFERIPARWKHTIARHAEISPLAAAIIQKAPASSIQTLRDFGFRPDRDTIVFAASAGCYDVAKGLLKECDTWDTERLTSSLDFMPLDMAIRNNNRPMVQLLIEHGEDVNSLQYQQIRWGRSPLQWAVDKGTSSIIEMLLEAGADVNQEAAENGGATALQLAAIQGYMDVAKTLIDKNADVNAPGACLKYGRTALQGAAENGRLDMAALLLSSGVRTQGSYRNSFIAAVALARNEGHCVVEKMLKERCGWTPEDQAGLKQLVSLRRWTEFLWDDWTDDDSMDSDCLWWYSYPSSEAGSQAYHHLGFATNQEDGRECETVGSGDPDVKVGMATLEKSRSHASTDVTDEDDINCLESEADLALDGSEEMGAWQEEISWPAFDAADLDGEMTNPFQHPSFDDETWAEAAAPFINDGFWYGPPI